MNFKFNYIFLFILLFIEKSIFSSINSLDQEDYYLACKFMFRFDENFDFSDAKDIDADLIFKLIPNVLNILNNSNLYNLKYEAIFLIIQNSFIKKSDEKGESYEKVKIELQEYYNKDKFRLLLNNYLSALIKSQQFKKSACVIL